MSSSDLARRIDLAGLPGFVLELVELALQRMQVEKIWLFGSRARSEAGAHSDFDLAFSVAPQSREEWAGFRLDAEDGVQTLHRFDLVRLDEVSPELAANIESEGIVLYERRQ